MSSKYLISVDQSTSGTKALLFDAKGVLLERADLPHEQLISENGWVEHRPMEIYHNTVQVVKDVIHKAGIDKNQVAGLGISNQRETALVWNRHTGEPVYNAVVWQCARGAAICKRIEDEGHAEEIGDITGLNLSPYFSAAKIAWVLENVEACKNLSQSVDLCAGTVDSWLVFKLTGGKAFKTDYSNASRTQMFDIHELKWSETVCGYFGISTKMLAQVCDSDSLFGYTDFEGYFDTPIPIHGVLGDSHGALFGQSCLNKGMIKATLGTGSSVMMNIGEKPVKSGHGLVTSLAWSMNGKVNYVLEGNINYAGAVIKWLVDDVHLMDRSSDANHLVMDSNPDDTTYLVPAFSGIGAPYWDSDARGAIVGMSRTTGKPELVKAALDCIAYQIYDIVDAMRKDAGLEIKELRVDGGPTKNPYLMQFESDILEIPVRIPQFEELSGIGAAYAAGLGLGFYDATVFDTMHYNEYTPQMDAVQRNEKIEGWHKAVKQTLGR